MYGTNMRVNAPLHRFKRASNIATEIVLLFLPIPVSPLTSVTLGRVLDFAASCFGDLCARCGYVLSMHLVFVARLHLQIRRANTLSSAFRILCADTSTHFDARWNINLFRSSADDTFMPCSHSNSFSFCPCFSLNC